MRRDACLPGGHLLRARQLWLSVHRRSMPYGATLSVCLVSQERDTQKGLACVDGRCACAPASRGCPCLNGQCLSVMIVVVIGLFVFSSQSGFAGFELRRLCLRCAERRRTTDANVVAAARVAAARAARLNDKVNFHKPRTLSVFNSASSGKSEQRPPAPRRAATSRPRRRRGRRCLRRDPSALDSVAPRSCSARPPSLLRRQRKVKQTTIGRCRHRRAHRRRCASRARRAPARATWRSARSPRALATR